LLVLTAPVSAQIGLYGNFTAGTQYRVTSNTTTSWTYGPTIGLFAEIPLPYFSIGADVRGQYITGDQLHHWNAMAGPRLEIRPFGIKPYAEFVVGFGGYQDARTSSNYTGHVDYAIVAGVDKKLVPLVDWRVVEFAYNSYFNNHNDLPGSKQFSTGLVIRF
jgi:hypothetical protein